MSNSIFLYGVSEEKFPISSDCMIGESSGEKIPFLWATLFNFSDLKFGKIIEDGEIYDIEYLVTNRENAIINLKDKEPVLKQCLPEKCHDYIDEWINCFEKELEMELVILDLAELIVLDLKKELREALDFTPKTFKTLLKKYKEEKIETFEALVGDIYIGNLDWPFDEYVPLL